MKNVTYYLMTGMACLGMMAFAGFTGMALFRGDAQAAQPDVQAASAAARSATGGIALPERDAPEAAVASNAYSSLDGAAQLQAVSDSAPGLAFEPMLPEGGRALFIGNSLVEGMALLGPDYCDYTCRTGISIDELGAFLPDPAGGGYDLAIIVMGSNEMGLWEEEDFIMEYSAVLDQISCPAVCLSVPPVCEKKSRYEERVNNINAAECSGWIQGLCQGREDAFYLDCGAFFGPSLDPGMTRDGLHLTDAGYKGWQGWILDTLHSNDIRYFGGGDAHGEE